MRSVVMTGRLDAGDRYARSRSRVDAAGDGVSVARRFDASRTAEAASRRGTPRIDLVLVMLDAQRMPEQITRFTRSGRRDRVEIALGDAGLDARSVNERRHPRCPAPLEAAELLEDLDVDLL